MKEDQKLQISFAGRFASSAIAACFAEVSFHNYLLTFYFLIRYSPSFINSNCICICLFLPQICTIPLDTAKVRLQLQKKATAGGPGAELPKYRGMLGTVTTIAREEGAAALWKGIVPGLQRQCIYGGLRIGLYEPVSLSRFTSSPLSSIHSSFLLLIINIIVLCFFFG